MIYKSFRVSTIGNCKHFNLIFSPRKMIERNNWNFNVSLFRSLSIGIEAFEEANLCLFASVERSILLTGDSNSWQKYFSEWRLRIFNSGIGASSVLLHKVTRVGAMNYGFICAKNRSQLFTYISRFIANQHLLAVIIFSLIICVIKRSRSSI